MLRRETRTFSVEVNIKPMIFIMLVDLIGKIVKPEKEFCNTKRLLKSKYLSFNCFGNREIERCFLDNPGCLAKFMHFHRRKRLKQAISQ